MKKLLSLMVIAAAAFAGGGLMNEHNLTTAVNYLYHKQQVGSVISLGSITSTPPAALPDHLPTVPGAVAPGNTAAAGATNPSQTIVKQDVAATVPPVVPPPAASASPVPASPPPPLSVNWPDQTTSTYHATPVAGADKTAPQPPPVETLPPPAPAPITAEALASASPVVPPPPLAQQLPKADTQIMQASFDPNAAKPRGPVEPTWPELMRKLQNHGVGQISLSGTTAGKMKLRCELAGADGLKAQPIEAEGDTPQAAAQAALKRVVLFNAARRASKSAMPQGNIPQFSSPAPPASLPPPADAPLPAPADVPS